MDDKNSRQSSVTEVVIDGHVYSLTGADSVYLQEVAQFLNRKLSEVKRASGYRHMDEKYQELLLNLNLADEYFQARREVELCRHEKDEMERELYSVKHEIVGLKMKLEAALKQQEVVERRSREWEKKYEEARKGAQRSGSRA